MIDTNFLWMVAIFLLDFDSVCCMDVALYMSTWSSWCVSSHWLLRSLKVTMRNYQQKCEKSCNSYNVVFTSFRPVISLFVVEICKVYKPVYHFFHIYATRGLKSPFILKLGYHWSETIRFMLDVCYNCTLTWYLYLTLSMGQAPLYLPNISFCIFGLTL